MPKYRLCPEVLICGWMALGACQNSDDQIKTYRVAKETNSPMPMAMSPAGTSANAGADMNSMGASMGMQPAGHAGEITWKTPSGWKELPASSMRVGSFQAKGSNGQIADISVIPLSGEAGGDLSNINRWRGQINLEPISEAELPQISQTISAGGKSMTLVDLVSREPLVDNRYPKRILAAVYKQGSRSWFFKMVGEDQSVREAKPAFLEFLRSLRFHDQN